MNCPYCHVALPDGARFCYACGQPIGAAAAPTPAPKAAAGPPHASAETQLLKCPACGAPISPVFGEMVITCTYCGGSITLGGAGWKEISKHTMLTPRITDRTQALKVVHDSLDQGLFHRHDFEESSITEEKLSFVPFWIIPTSATTTYQYQDVAVGIGSTVGSIAAAELLGSALGGGRGGGFMVMPMMMGSPVNATRSDTLTGSYEYPVVAVKGMAAYQPREYEFALSERGFFDRKGLPDGAVVLNGDLGEDAAQHSARSFVLQLQSDAVHKRHHMVSRIQSTADIADGELLHVPIWYFQLNRKGVKSMILIDAHAGRVIRTVDGPAL
ncbi:MAG: zinc ribbon domain-containing protein [Thermoplasmata archaeon]